MASKAMITFGMLLVFVLFVTSKVAADEELNHQVQDFDHGRGGSFGPGNGGHNGGGFGPGNGGGFGPGNGGHNGGGFGPGNGGHNGGGFGPGNGGGHGRGGCRFSCCRRGFNGCVCCAHPNDVREPMYIPEVGH